LEKEKGRKEKKGGNGKKCRNENLRKQKWKPEEQTIKEQRKYTHIPGCLISA
jgi:hypothetical protein